MIIGVSHQLPSHNFIIFRLLTVLPFVGIVAPVVLSDITYGGVAQLVEQTAHIRSVRGPSPFAARCNASLSHVLTGYGEGEAFFVNNLVGNILSLSLLQRCAKADNLPI